MMYEQSRSADSSIAVLLLEDGHFFLGQSFGFANNIGSSGGQLFATERERLCGELCFNTGMSGYQEILSDPSYAGQMICFSFPHIGNVGVNTEDYESEQPRVLAMITREQPSRPSNWRSENSLEVWLKYHRISGICGLDTRVLIHHLRQNGSVRALLGTLSPEMLQQDSAMHSPKLKIEYYELLLAELQLCPQMIGRALSTQVSCEKKTTYNAVLWAKWFPLEVHSGNDAAVTEAPVSSSQRQLHVAALDFGIKENILQSLQRFAVKVTVLPLQSSWQDIVDLQPDGLFLSNGPGDPEPIYQQVSGLLQEALVQTLPVFGICLGHQILALSLGAKTLYMHHGHRGINHPVFNVARATVEITAQNHGFCVEEASLPDSLEITHRSLFDSSIEGIRSLDYPAFSVQYHPESSPGPHDSMYLFRDFSQLMEKNPNVFSK